MIPINQFTIPFFAASWTDLRARIEKTRWIDEIPGSEWDYGFNREFLVELCEYWSTDFDWELQVERLNQLPNYRFQSQYGSVHFLHLKGRGKSSLPLIMTHGWPGSYLEMLEMIPLLTDPIAHGANSADSFDLVIPSLPGFGFSDRPASAGMNAFRIADIWVDLMRSLGYERFGAQGGDLGAAVSTALGLRHGAHLHGIHLNYIPGSYQPFLAPGTVLADSEQQFLQKRTNWFDKNGGYAHQQATRPQTTAYALNDSPAGLAAWIVEKFREWSDCESDLYSRFSRDALLTNVTLYWMTETISSSFRMYSEGRAAPLAFSPEDFVHAPCAVARFPREITFPPREWVERGYNIQRWTAMSRGGHFAASEEPALLAADLREFFRPLRE